MLHHTQKYIRWRGILQDYVIKTFLYDWTCSKLSVNVNIVRVNLISVDILMTLYDCVTDNLFDGMYYSIFLVNQLYRVEHEK